jgi:DedD protein
MPRSVSDEEIELRKRARRRLVGAIVLVTVAVMILPMVLDQEPPPVSQDIAVIIPPKGDAASFAPRAAPATETPRPGAPAAGAAPPAPQAAAKPPGEATGAREGAEKPRAPRSEKPADVAAAAGAEAFVVQLDAFSNPENARQQQKKLSAAGIASYTETVMTQKGALTRVRVGPFADRQQAEEARERLGKMGLSAVVVPK